jgi:hypothetical protein
MWRNILIHLCVVTYRLLFNFLVRSATNTKNPSQLRQTQPRTVNSNHSVGSGDSGKVEWAIIQLYHSENKLHSCKYDDVHFVLDMFFYSVSSLKRLQHRCRQDLSTDVKIKIKLCLLTICATYMYVLYTRKLLEKLSKNILHWTRWNFQMSWNYTQ